jgi:hypothetical protein
MKSSIDPPNGVVMLLDTSNTRAVTTKDLTGFQNL